MVSAKRKSLVSFLIPLVAAILPLSAQQRAPQPNMAPPVGERVGAEGRRLAFLLGAWEERIRYPGESPEQKEETGTGRWFARPALGRFVQFNYEGTTPQGQYRALGMLSYDRDAQTYRLLWFDDVGGVGDYRGNFVDENTLSLEHRSKVEGRDFRERISFTRVSATEIHTKIEQAWDGGVYRVYLDADATRAAAGFGGPLRRGRPPERPPAN